ncbi:MAG: guanylate kinase [Clostridia bacterium]|nr:guanylate kinase [Clostridia bacterium]
MEKGKLIVISGPSGVGKGTIKTRLLSELENITESISCTTRKPRIGEVHGVHYFFKTEEEFENMLKKDMFFENAGVFGKRYGTPKEFVENKRNCGVNVLLEIDVQGALQVKDRAPDALLIMLLPEKLDVLKERLKGRGTETEEQINGRFAKAVAEIMEYKAFDYAVVNKSGELDNTVLEIERIIRGEVKDQEVEKIVKSVIG